MPPVASSTKNDPAEEKKEELRGMKRKNEEEGKKDEKGSKRVKGEDVKKVAAKKHTSKSLGVKVLSRSKKAPTPGKPSSTTPNPLLHHAPLPSKAPVSKPTSPKSAAHSEAAVPSSPSPAVPTSPPHTVEPSHTRSPTPIPVAAEVSVEVAPFASGIEVATPSPPGLVDQPTEDTSAAPPSDAITSSPQGDESAAPPPPSSSAHPAPFAAGLALLARMGPMPAQGGVNNDAVSADSSTTNPVNVVEPKVSKVYSDIFGKFEGDVVCDEVLKVKLSNGDEVMIGLGDFLNEGNYGKIRKLHPNTPLEGVGKMVAKLQEKKGVEKEFKTGELLQDGSRRARLFVRMGWMGKVLGRYDGSLAYLSEEEVKEGLKVDKEHMIIMDEHLPWVDEIKALRAEFDRDGFSEEIDNTLKCWCTDLRDGLLHLLEKRISHQDLKPGNILITNDRSHLVFCDFGSAVEFGGTWTQATESYLTPQMMRIRGMKLVREHFTVGNITVRQRTEWKKSLDEVCKVEHGVNGLNDFAAMAYILWAVIDYIIFQSKNHSLNGPIKARLPYMKPSESSCANQIRKSLSEWKKKGFSCFSKQVNEMAESSVLQLHPAAVPYVSVLQNMVNVLDGKPEELEEATIWSCFEGVCGEGEDGEGEDGEGEDGEGEDREGEDGEE